jgi:hypothetical protein
MQDYMVRANQAVPIEAHFLGQYLPWDSRRNAEVATSAGMRNFDHAPSAANWWVHENLDNAQTGIHDYFMWLKYGFGRGCQQISVDVRTGVLQRRHALDWVEHHDHLFPTVYAGVDFEGVLASIGMRYSDFSQVCDRFRNEAVHAG